MQRSVFGLLAASFALMVWEKLSLDLVAMSALLVTGILTPAAAFKLFSNDTAITIACMFAPVVVVFLPSSFRWPPRVG